MRAHPSSQSCSSISGLTPKSENLIHEGAGELTDILPRKERRGIDELCRAVILGSNADLSSLTEAQRRCTEAIISRVAQRAALVSRKMPRALAGNDDVAMAPTA